MNNLCGTRAQILPIDIYILLSLKHKCFFRSSPPMKCLQVWNTTASGDVLCRNCSIKVNILSCDIFSPHAFQFDHVHNSWIFFFFASTTNVCLLSRSPAPMTLAVLDVHAKHFTDLLYYYLFFFKEEERWVMLDTDGRLTFCSCPIFLFSFFPSRQTKVSK